MDIIQLYHLRRIVLLAGQPSNYITDDKQLADVLDALLYKHQQAEGHYFDPIYVTPKQLRCIKHCVDINYLSTVVRLLIAIEEKYREKCEAGDRRCICEEFINHGGCKHLCPCNSYAYRCDSALEDIGEAASHAITSIAKDKGLI